MKKWLMVIIWAQCFVVIQGAGATSLTSLEYIVTGDFFAIENNATAHNAYVTGWLDVDLLDHTISDVTTPADAGLSHTYGLSFYLDIAVDIDNDNDLSNDRFYTFTGSSELRLLTMADMYLSLGDFGLYSTDDGETNLPWLGEGEGAGLWHYADFDLHDLTYFTLSNGASGERVCLDDLEATFNFLDFTQVPVSPIPEPSTMLLFLVGLIGFAGYKAKNKKNRLSPLFISEREGSSLRVISH